MKKLKENNKKRAICNNCKKIVSTTFKIATYKVEELEVPEVLQGFCDECGSMIAFPHQSTIKINEYRKNERNRKSIKKV